MTKLNVMVAVAMLLMAGVAVAQAQPTPMPPTPQARPTPMPPMPQAKVPDEQMMLKAQRDLEQFRTKLEQSNLGEEKIMDTMYVAGAKVEPFDPAHVLAVKDELKLTDEQVKKLKDLVSSTQGQVREILNEQQQEKIAKIQPTTVYHAMQETAPMIEPSPGQRVLGRPVTPMPPTTTPPAVPQHGMPK